MNQPVFEQLLPGGQRLQIVQGDITREAVDVIVNAANAYLMHGGGVAGAIVLRGGEIIQEESTAWVRQHGLVTHAAPAYTSAGKLPCRFVIHAVGPVWGDGDEDIKLAQAVAGSLHVADELGLVSLALPAISTGIFGFPKERAAGVICPAICDYFVAQPTSSLKLVRLTIIDEPTVHAFQQTWDKLVRGG